MLQSIRTNIGVLLGPLARRWTAASPRILMYHRFGQDYPGALGVEELELHLRYIRTNFCPLRLDRLIAMLASGEPPPSRAVALTVDDGYRDFLDHAYPLLARYEVPATLFVVSRFLQGDFWLWIDRLRYAFEHTEAAEFRIMGGEDSVRVGLSTVDSRLHAWRQTVAHCRRLSDAERNASVARCEELLGVRLPSSPPGTYAPLLWEDLRQMDPQLVEIGSHTRTHPILSTCNDAAVTEEICQSKLEIEAELGRSVASFCYPNGMPEDIDARAVRAVAQAGYAGAVVAYGDLTGRGENLLTLPRLSAFSGFRSMRNQLNGVTHLATRGWPFGSSSPRSGGAEGAYPA
ncbi:MAG TPA: polysaccharide deacetylase family protein [Steroidobacteraceae bacterium]|nr:polysaccharide deacetylase family protein [Steroidobacteraceae bacterium]